MILSSSQPGCAIERVILNDGHLVVFAQARRVHGRCPTYGTTSSAIHRRYERRPADLPNIGQPNAQAEGQISRLKMLKCVMYGRASYGLLRRRVLLVA
ncbi:hypothetical protein [Methylobacterium sp. 22177]|uniref:hypothetical protein n=1 Tax=Methylobacterium sp. 22177 TaxID=3453885 RepID=UPI003F863493